MTHLSFQAPVAHLVGEAKRCAREHKVLEEVRDDMVREDR
jgi:hypothetical protein